MPSDPGAFHGEFFEGGVLGVILDESLTFQKHINYLSAIINIKLYLFNKGRKYMTCKTALNPI